MTTSEYIAIGILTIATVYAIRLWIINPDWREIFKVAAILLTYAAIFVSIFWAIGTTLRMLFS